VNVLKRIFDFYLDASIHVALAVFSMVYLTGLILHIPIDHNLALFLFFSTIASYNFIKYGLEAEKYILVANRYHKNIQFFSFIALGFGIYHGYFLTLNTWMAIAILAVLIGLYALPVLPKAKNFRSLSGFKIFPVGLVWAGTTVILPIIQVHGTIGWDSKVEFAQRFLMVLVLLLPFEIRDLKYDAPELRTLPQRYGVKNTKVIGAFLVIFILISTFFKDEIDFQKISIKAVIGITLLIALVMAERDRSKYFASFWVELLPVFWFALAWLVYEMT